MLGSGGSPEPPWRLGQSPLPANQDQNASCQRQDSGHDRGDTDVKERGDSNEDKIDGEQKHSEIFGDVHTSFLRQVPRVCTPKKAGGKGEVYSFFNAEAAEDLTE
jgi:hypothetical protein